MFWEYIDHFEYLVFREYFGQFEDSIGILFILEPFFFFFFFLGILIIF